VAQKKYTYIYDKNGTEIHCLKKHIFPKFLEFLPYHFLLVSVGKSSLLNYQDVSTGSLIASIKVEIKLKFFFFFENFENLI
jgi:U3 small nucleolar RNA-associated protein 7